MLLLCLAVTGACSVGGHHRFFHLYLAIGLEMEDLTAKNDRQ